MVEPTIDVRVRFVWWGRAVCLAAPVIRHLPRPARAVAAALLLSACQIKVGGRPWESHF